MMEETKIKKFRYMKSYQKERKWLEEMALQGWFLENISMGVFYTFVKGDPKRMLYDMDRFALPKNPTLEEIRHKEIFLDMAKELGWQEVTHSESMVYYFAKEYEENGINELHNDEESRRYMADKFRNYYAEYAKRLVFWSALVVGVDIVIRLLGFLIPSKDFGWYHWFTLIYAFLVNCTAVHGWKEGIRIGKELSMSRQEWEAATDPAVHKTVRKLIFTTRKLNKFLRSQEEQGWILTSVTPTRYSFEKSQGLKQIYTMDSKRLTNIRQKEQRQGMFQDKKDWNGINNDWEIQSIRDAEEKGWSFVCALENRAIIYRGNPEETQPLNDPKYDKSIRWISMIGEYGFYMLCCGLFGAVIGFLVAFMTL